MRMMELLTNDCEPGESEEKSSKLAADLETEQAKVVDLQKSLEEMTVSCGVFVSHDWHAYGSRSICLAGS